MGETHGHRQAAATTKRLLGWDDLPCNMQLLVVKEMTSWQSYEDVVNDWLCLTGEQKHRFETLYNETLRKQIEADKEARESIAEQWTNQEEQEHHSGIPGWSSRSHGSSQPVLALIADKFRLAQAADVFVVAHHEIALAQAFLRSIGAVRRSADLGHWLGHSGRDRFVIDHDSHILCVAGAHAMPDTEGVPSRPCRPLPMPMPTIPEQGTSRQCPPPVSLTVPVPEPQQPRRRGRPRRQDPLPDARPPSGVRAVGIEDLVVPDSASLSDGTISDETAASITPEKNSPEELARIDRLRREAAAVLASYRTSSGRPVNTASTEDTDEDHTE